MHALAKINPRIITKLNKRVTMKNYFKLLAVVVLLGTFTSCEQDLIIFNQGQFAQLTSTTAASIGESSGTVVPITVNLAEQASSDVTISLEITGADASRFSLTAPSITIPSGQATGEVGFSAVDNLDVDGNVDVTIRLSASSSVPVGIGGEGLNGLERVITIVDDDCPIVTASSYNVDVFAFDTQAPSHTVNLVPVMGTTNQFTITSSWGPEFVAFATGNPGFSGQFLYSGTITLNPDFTVDFAGDDAWATGGTGTYSSCDDQFSITLTQALFTTDFTVDIVMTGN